MKNNRCPFCFKTFTYTDRYRFTKWLCFRKPDSCLDCGALIISNTWPWRIMHLGMFVIMIFIWPLMFNREDLIPQQVNILIMLGGISLIFAGMVTSRYLIIKKPYH